MTNLVRQRWIDVCKGIAIIFVVAGHVSTSYENSGLIPDGSILVITHNIAYGFHMALFFVLSGYLLSISDLSKPKLLRKKMISYGIPYVCFSIAIWCLKLLASSVVNTKVDYFDIFKILLFPFTFLWFIYALLIINIVHILVVKSLCNRLSKYFIVIFALFVKLAGVIIQNLEIVRKSGFSEFILFDVVKFYFWFVLGFYFLKSIVDQINRFVDKKISTFFILFILVAVYCVMLFSLSTSFPISFFVELFLAILGSVIIIVISYLINKCGLLEYLGKSTLPIYLLHTFFISFFRILITKMKIPLFNGITPLIICSVGSMVLSVVLYNLISKIKYMDFIFYPSKYIKV